MADRIPLADMEARETGAVSEILGGFGLRARLRALGLRPGSTLTRISAASSRGPVTVQMGGTQVSIGFGVSYKIVVEVYR